MQKERILCSAINYQGIIISGYRHGDCHKTLKDILIKNNINVDDKELPQREDQGFLTSHNRFVDRKEAFIIAKNSNQIIHHMFDNDSYDTLTSEDLW